MISLEKPQRKWASSRLEEKPPGFSRVAAGALDLRRGPQGPALVASGKASPHATFGGLSGFLCRRCRGLRPCVESGPEPEDPSPVLTWILGYFWSLPRGVSPRLECGHALSLPSRAVAAVSCSPPRGSKDLWFSLEPFPRGFPTRLSQRAVPRAHVVRVDPQLERQGSAGKTGSSGMD